MAKDSSGQRYRDAGTEIVDERTDIITGEGVGLVLPTAALGTRIVSASIDYGSYLLLALLTFYVVSDVWEPANFAQAATWVTTTLLVWAIGLPFIVQYLTRGSSPGRRVTGTRTVRHDGGTIGMRHALTRSIAGLFDIYLTAGVLATVGIISTDRAQRPGDLLAGTIVVRWPRGYKGPEPLPIDASLGRWAQVATIHPIPGMLGIAARDYLRTAKTMTPEARLTRARDLAAALESHTAPPPPRGTNPDVFITTVLAIREAADFQLARGAMDRQMKTEERMNILPYSIPTHG